MRVIWYTAASIDGRIADANDNLDFLETIGDRGHENANEFDEFMADIDAVVVGATTLRWLIRGGHGWPHDDLPTWLVTHDESLADQVWPTRQPIVRVEGPLETMFDDIAKAGHKRVWLCGGGAVAGQALALDRVDEVVLTVAPTVLGAGPAIFESADLQLPSFRLAECRPAGGGCTPDLGARPY